MVEQDPVEQVLVDTFGWGRLLGEPMTWLLTLMTRSMSVAPQWEHFISFSSPEDKKMTSNISSQLRHRNS